MANKIKVSDKVKNSLDLQSPLSKGQLVPGKVASLSDTMRSMKGTSNPAVSRYMDRIVSSGLRDNVHVNPPRLDDSERPRPETTNLPAVIGTALEKTGGFKVKWHQVKNLPGYLQSAIRAMGRAVFAPVTKTPIEDIYVISTLSNNESELNYMGSWVKQHGVRNDKMEMKFEQLLPGYGAEVHVWSVEGFTFVVVKDPFGKYIYGWPDADSKGPAKTKYISGS